MVVRDDDMARHSPNLSGTWSDSCSLAGTQQPSTSIDLLNDHPVTDVRLLCGGEAFVTSSPNSLSLWTPSEDSSFECLITQNLSDVPTVMSMLNGNTLAVGLDDGSVTFARCGLQGIEVSHTFPDIHTSEVSALVSDSTGELIVSGGADGSITLLSGATGQTKQLTAWQSGVRALTLLQSGHIVASGHLAGQLLLWDLREGEAKPAVQVAIQRDDGAITALDTHIAQTNVFCFGTEYGTVGFIDVRMGGTSVCNPYEVSTQEITEVMFHPSLGENLFSSSEDGTLVHWDASATHQYSLASASSEGRSCSWISPHFPEAVKLTSVVEKSCIPITSFDLSGNTAVIALDNQMIRYIEGLRLV